MTTAKEKRNLLFEIGTEEIPVRFMDSACSQIKEMISKGLAEARLAYSDLKVWGTPRRFALLVQDLDTMQEDISVEVKGPAEKSAYDAEGKPSKALEGFCKGQGVASSDVFVKELNGVPYVYAMKHSEGKATAALLPQMLMDCVQKIYFPKPMRWADLDMRFARPIRWIVALWGSDILPIEIAGVKAGKYSRGHRFLSTDHVEITCPLKYQEIMRENFVIVDQEERKNIIWKQIQEVAKSCHGVVKEDEELLEEVTYLLEYPTALVGNFDESYLLLPPEVIITPMREHQRYFPVYGEDGKLINKFITVRNGVAEHIETVAAGNEKVLRARLSDAEFFWKEDLEKSLDDNVEKLRNIVFHEKLGTIYQKMERTTEIGAYLGKELGLDIAQLEKLQRAMFLLKADLVSNMVYEFPELQGIMGEYYGQKAGEDREVSQAIREHYLPRFAGDALPESKIGMIAAIADKIDSIVGMFAIGLIPTGSQDPFALRRQATGISQIIIQKQLPISIQGLAGVACDLFAGQLGIHVDKDKVLADTALFFEQRLENILSDNGIAIDVIHSVTATMPDDLYQTKLKADAIATFQKTEQFAHLMGGFKRAANLVKANPVEQQEIKEGLLSDVAEKTLYAAILQVEAAVATCVENGDYQGVLAQVASLAPAIDSFFEAVMVMAEDAAIRNNRLSLLTKIVALPALVGSLDLLQN
ncbi:MAG: glycine--tRNA ligase subunit beta [Peptococcaceae bacterium]|nr:glycine--tRNA ligase subunit beta [Peptococcaceae bacterium]